MREGRSSSGERSAASVACALSKASDLGRASCARVSSGPVGLGVATCACQPGCRAISRPRSRCSRRSLCSSGPSLPASVMSRLSWSSLAISGYHSTSRGSCSCRCTSPACACKSATAPSAAARRERSAATSSTLPWRSAVLMRTWSSEISSASSSSRARRLSSCRRLCRTAAMVSCARLASNSLFLTSPSSSPSWSRSARGESPTSRLALAAMAPWHVAHAACSGALTCSMRVISRAMQAESASMALSVSRLASPSSPMHRRSTGIATPMAAGISAAPPSPLLLACAAASAALPATAPTRSLSEAYLLPRRCRSSYSFLTVTSVCRYSARAASRAASSRASEGVSRRLACSPSKPAFLRRRCASISSPLPSSTARTSGSSCSSRKSRHAPWRSLDVESVS
mmetsp:Transcript_51392/g.123629  ORF Transcript_51392/g.123629 Transcript_51392/m.123629 type:complete len:400 (+) Transcript_51392:221-1420(+)